MPQLHFEESEQSQQFFNPNVVKHDDGSLEYRTTTNRRTVILHNCFEVLALRIWVDWRESYSAYASWNSNKPCDKKMRHSCQRSVNKNHQRMERLKKRYPELTKGIFRTFDL
jgi:hypothetical protein